MDEVKLGRPLERLGDMKVFGHFGIDGGIFFVTLVHHGMEASAGDRIPAGEQSHIPASGDEPFGYVACDRFPSAVLPRSRPPGYRRKNSHSFFRLCHALRRDFSSWLVI